MHVADAPVAQPPAPAVADALSAEVAMQDLPAGVTRDVPPVRGHKFVSSTTASSWSIRRAAWWWR